MLREHGISSTAVWTFGSFAPLSFFTVSEHFFGSFHACYVLKTVLYRSVLAKDKESAFEVHFSFFTRPVLLGSDLLRGIAAELKLRTIKIPSKIVSKILIFGLLTILTKLCAFREYN